MDLIRVGVPVTVDADAGDDDAGGIDAVIGPSELAVDGTRSKGWNIPEIRQPRTGATGERTPPDPETSGGRQRS